MRNSSTYLKILKISNYLEGLDGLKGLQIFGNYYPALETLQTLQLFQNSSNLQSLLVEFRWLRKVLMLMWLNYKKSNKRAANKLG